MSFSFYFNCLPTSVHSYLDLRLLSSRFSLLIRVLDERRISRTEFVFFYPLTFMN